MKAYFCAERLGGKLANAIPALSVFDELLEVSDPSEADFLFTDHQPKSLRKLFSIKDTGQIRVLLAREAISPDMNLFDYAISFDQTIFGERVFRPHTLLTFETELKWGNIDTAQFSDPTKFFARPRFCDYIYGNARAHPMRRKIFLELSHRYDGVESYGTHLTTRSAHSIPQHNEMARDDWRAEKIWIQSHHKFSITAENARFPGYTSEKLLTSFIAGSIPIYWGNPLVAQEFNHKRFIDFDGMDFDVLEGKISDLMGSQDRMSEMLQEPALTESQREELDRNRAELLKWFDRLFSESPSALQRRPRGWYPDWHAELIAVAYRRQKVSPARVAGLMRALTGSNRS